ncbi:MAG: hypothetical protein K8M05_25565, partial [Deltaproteobacteria bacterium]|nr:hypothetical protein [Kofleriaceae bacterium]
MPAFRCSISLALTLTIAGTTTAAAQVLQRRFDPDRNGPWTVVDLGQQDRDVVTHDPRAFAVGEGGEVHAVCKVPLEGPPTGGAVLRVDRGAAEPIGGPLGDDPAAILATGGTLFVAGKGFGAQPARVLRLDGGTWIPAHDGALDSEMRGLAMHDGSLHVATKSDGVYRLDGRALDRVGATTTVQPEGYAWEALGDYVADIHDGALAPDGALVVAGKDQRVRRWDGEAWRDLGNLSEATWDAAGVPVGFVREPKGVGVAPDGTIYVGTKGLDGSSEGRDRGAVWRWTGVAWERVGTVELRKEAKRVIPLAGGSLVAGTNESGVFRWDGGAWTAINAGLPVDAGGKIKGERLFLAADGQLYVAIQNAIYRRGTGATGAWTEVGFFPLGEEVTFVGVALGRLHAGCKVGASAGAVYVQESDGWSQLGGDLPRDVKQLAWSPGGDLYAVMGAGAGTVRWSGGAWSSVLGNLTGDASDFKQLILPTDSELFGVSKLGVQRGAFRREPIEIVDFALKNRAVTAIGGAGGHLFAIAETDGVFRRTAGATTDDGLDWVVGTSGLPDVELRGIATVGDRTFVLGKHLLYEGVVGADGTLALRSFGTNPGKAALDGNGQLIFTGETDFTALAAHGDRLFVGTKDGLFVTRAGRVWELYNGPAEVKALAIVGDLLHVAVKAKEVPDPAEPTRELHSAQVWIHDLRDDEDDGRHEPAAGGCAVAGGSGAA